MFLFYLFHIIISTFSTNTTTTIHPPSERRIYSFPGSCADEGPATGLKIPQDNLLCEETYVYNMVVFTKKNVNVVSTTLTGMVVFDPACSDSGLEKLLEFVHVDLEFVYVDLEFVYVDLEFFFPCGWIHGRLLCI
jgi:hypothetical protein